METKEDGSWRTLRFICGCATAFVIVFGVSVIFADSRLFASCTYWNEKKTDAMSVKCDADKTNCIPFPIAVHYENNNHLRQTVAGFKVAPLRFTKCPMCNVTAKESGDDVGGGIVVCFGCREVYWREPIRAVWHTEFCPRCCKDGDKRWNDEIKDSKGEVLPLSGSRHMWEHFKMTLQQDVANDKRWIAGAGSGK